MLVANTPAVRAAQLALLVVVALAMGRSIRIARTVLFFAAVVAFNLVSRGRLDGWYPNALDIHPFRFIRFKRLEGPRGVAGAPPPAPTG